MKALAAYFTRYKFYRNKKCIRKEKELIGMRNEGWILKQIVEIKRGIYVYKFEVYLVMLTKIVSDFVAFAIAMINPFFFFLIYWTTIENVFKSDQMYKKFLSKTPFENEGFLFDEKNIGHVQ